MNITSFEFALFFAAVLPLNWILRPRAGLYRLFLLLTSYVFYASFNAKFLLILLVFSFLTWFFAVVFAETSDARFRRFCLILYTAFSLGMLSANDELDPNHLQVGQLVTIPGAGHPVASADALVFPVSTGDTLWSIARRFDVSVAAIIEANPGIDPLRLREGQTVHVPSSMAAVASPTRKPEQTPVVSGSQPGAQPVKRHSIVSGETLWQLARRFGISLDDLLAENVGIDPARLQVGQTLRLPGSVVSMTPSEARPVRRVCRPVCVAWAVARGA